MRRARAVLAAVAVALGAAAPVRTDAAVGTVRCDAIGFSPDFARDGTALCVAQRVERPDLAPTGVDVFRTTDGGRTWARRAGTGLAFRPDSRWREVVFSARYAADRTLYVQEERDGLYASSDGGATFTLVDGLARSGAITPSLAAFAGFRLPVGEPMAAVAYTGGGRVAVLLPPLHLPAAGAPGTVEQWLLPPGFPDRRGYAVVRGPSTGGAPTAPVLHACDAALSCAERVREFGPGHRVLFAAVGTAGGVDQVVVATMPSVSSPAAHQRREVWRSRDAGRTWARWPQVEALLDQTGEPDAAGFLAAGPDGAWYLLVDHHGRDTDVVPARQLFRSRDDGRTWARLAFGRSLFQRGPAGTLSEPNYYAPQFNRTRFWLTPHGRFLLLGLTPDGLSSALSCSPDGVRWGPTCR